MKSSVFLAATSAMLAMAGPVLKRSYTTDVVVEWITVTVTGDAPESTTTTSAQRTFFNGGKHHSYSPLPSSVAETTVASAPTTTAPSVVIVTETYQPSEPVSTAPATTEEPATSEASTVVDVPATSATSTQAAVVSPTDMASTALYAHNLHRANHSAPAMAWLDEIAGYAENTANTCKFAHDMTQGSGNYGQNIAMWATSDGAADLGEAGAIDMASQDMWYNGEVTKYLPSYYGEATPDMSDFESWGHFSQLVWKDSTSLGCYAKLCAKGTMYADMDAWYMVCNYRPAGNVGGAYGTNVLTSLGEPSVSS
ncbi:scp-like extracellular protein [Xylariales sp. AK1849]|nr:scp-like extracellular protein [Xylariales sp. AK1849]